MKIEFIQEQLAQIINREALVPGALITLNNLVSDDKGSQIKVWVSVLPEHFSGSALRELRKKANIMSNYLAKKVKLRRSPRLTFAIDGSLPEAIELVNTIDNLWKE